MYCNDQVIYARDSKRLLKFWRDEVYANLDSNKETDSRASARCLVGIETNYRIRAPDVAPDHAK
jgi:hypothetical protein